ncbi:MAG: hypothetical protein LBG96_16735 [Tannerella sp.]|jgi:hypothetical protein|nr:hypothetical protein [Tannerella sp.]
MILIDETYFTGELMLPNIPVNPLPESGTALALQTAGEKNLDVFVDKYVTDYLVRLFGRSFTRTFLDALELPTPGRIWLDLKDQLLIKTGSYKASPLANYVYYMVSSAAVTKTTQAGECDPDFDNSQNAFNRRKFSRAWNEMADMTRKLLKWFDRQWDVYGEYMTDCEGMDRKSIADYTNEFGI